jgi:hypothetical protein
VELLSDAGNRYAIFRPGGGQHCVVDVDNSEDVTELFRARDGRINILDRAGLTLPVAKRAMRITSADLTTDSKTDDWLQRLALIDPGRLWDVARKFKDREARLGEAATEAGSTPEAAELYQEIERRHRAFEEVQEEHERARHLSFLVAAGAALLSIPGLLMIGPIVAVALLLVAGGMGAYSATFLRKLHEARREEEAALAAAGEHSYLTFQINRVNGLIASDHQRKRMIQAAEDHRAAAAEWQVLVGDVPIDWAIERRAEIERAHARYRDVIGDHNPMALSLSQSKVTAAEVGALLGHRLAATKTLGAGRESMPSLLDEPFGDLAKPAKAELLEQLLASAQGQQIILLTDDPEIADWARVESLTGAISLIEPAASHELGHRPGPPNSERGEGGRDGNAVLPSPKRRSRHVAA